MRNIRYSLAIAAAVFALCITAHATPVPFADMTWGAAMNISGDTDVSTAGTLLYAYNIGGAGVPSVTVNTVTFDSFAINGDNPTIVGNVSLQESPNVLVGDSSFGSGFFAPFSTLSPEYQTLLFSAGYALQINDLMLTFEGLTNGQQYQFETWLNESSNGAAAVIYDTTVQAISSISLDANVTNSNGGLGQYVIGTFTATDTHAKIMFTGTNTGGAPTINAFQLRAIPEPSTWALLGFASLALFAIRRRLRA